MANPPESSKAADDQLRRTTSRNRHANGIATSPPVVEATLADISNEVMEEAIARRNLVPEPKSPKPE